MEKRQETRVLAKVVVAEEAAIEELLTAMNGAAG